MDERERRRGDEGAREQRHRGRAHVREHEREHGRHEQLSRRRRRTHEQRIRAAVTRREADERDLRSGRRAGERRGVEERVAGLVRDHDGEREKQRALVLDDERGVDARELRHGGEERVPERKRVARMQTAVDELVHPPERQRPEIHELAHAREMERAVARQRRRRDVPEEHAEHESCARRDPASRDRRLELAAPARPARSTVTPSSSHRTSANDVCTTKTTPSAVPSAASVHASVAATVRSPSARAISPPGTSTASVAAPSRTNSPTPWPGRSRDRPTARSTAATYAARRITPSASSSGTGRDASQRAIRRYCRSRGARSRQPANMIQRARSAARSP